MNIQDFKGDKFLINFDFENRIEYFYSPIYYYVNDIYSGYYDLKDITSNFTEQEMEKIKNQKPNYYYDYDDEGNRITKYVDSFKDIFYTEEKKTGKLKKVFRRVDYIPLYYWSYMKKEQFGRYLIRFLNADFSNFESAFNDFFKYYGFSFFAFRGTTEVLRKEYVGENFLNEISKIYRHNKKDLIYIQEKYREIVNYIYFDKKYKEYSNYYKLYAYTVFYNLSKYVLNPVNLLIFNDEENEIFFYPENLENVPLSYFPEKEEEKDKFEKSQDYDSENYISKISTIIVNSKDCDNYIDKENDEYIIPIYFDELVRRIDKEKRLEKIKSSKFYASNNFSTLLFLVLRKFVEYSSLPIKKCENCGKYFIPSIRNSEKYCQFIYKDGKTCREIAPEITFANNTESVNYIYRKIYKRKYNETKTKRQNEQIQKNFEKWKKNAKEKMNEYKKGKISEKNILEWLEKNN